jgi:alkanesulfonate monooxygenase SsuD/methylene tetrahydromethanopterin reductase-like flavin-dependent oxidoreductase (luciferase family)
MSFKKLNAMRGPNRFKLGVFSANADGGLAITAVRERWTADWDQIVAVAQMADRAGFEFFLPIARWKGFGGATNTRHLSYETLTFGAALGALTERITVFSTVHVPFVHPVFAAKALATIDHVSHGRAGLNIVCGWNEPEYAMFGAKKPEAPYDQGLEWFDILNRILKGGAPFDYEGKYYHLKGVEGAPATVQQPRPIVLSAAFSPPGRDFAAQTSDYIFTTFMEIADGAQTIEDVRARAVKAGRELGVFTTCHVVCRETQAEAEAYYERYAVTEADQGAVDTHMAMKKEMSASHDRAAYDLYRQRFAGGVGTYPLVGTPERIVEEMVKMSRIGFAGTTLSFVNYLYELPFFIDRVLPLMVEAGLRDA